MLRQAAQEVSEATNKGTALRTLAIGAFLALSVFGNIVFLEACEGTCYNDRGEQVNWADGLLKSAAKGLALVGL